MFSNSTQDDLVSKSDNAEVPKNKYPAVPSTKLGRKNPRPNAAVCQQSIFLNVPSKNMPEHLFLSVSDISIQDNLAFPILSDEREKPKNASANVAPEVKLERRSKPFIDEESIIEPEIFTTEQRAMEPPNDIGHTYKTPLHPVCSLYTSANPPPPPGKKSISRLDASHFPAFIPLPANHEPFVSSESAASVSEPATFIPDNIFSGTNESGKTCSIQKSKLLPMKPPPIRRNSSASKAA